MTNVKYYIATSEANDQMYSEGDIIECDLSKDYDGYLGKNLTNGKIFCPFNFSGVKEISEEELEEKKRVSFLKSRIAINSYELNNCIYTVERLTDTQYQMTVYDEKDNDIYGISDPSLIMNVLLNGKRLTA